MFLKTIKSFVVSLEEQLLLFPVLVTVGLAATYLLGGHLSVWHWWGAVIVIMGMCVLRKQWRAGGAFLFFLAALWFLAGISACIAHVDYPAYHFPGIRLLIHGWNPVTQSTFADLEQMGIALNEVHPYHLLFTQKAAWYFSASAYTFTHTPLNLLMPLFAFLFCSVVIQLWRMLSGMHWIARLLACVYLWHFSVNSDVLVDCVVTLSGVGLLCAMVRVLRGDKGVFLPLIVFSFWMMTAKLPSLLTCFVFWGCFSIAWLIQSRAAFLRLAALGGILVALFCITCASPYYTAWRDYSHPLYPAMTSDEVAHPTVDMVADFRHANEDALRMGPIGDFMNAYISNALTLAYYRWKYDDPEFAPSRETWKQYNSADNPTSPTEPKRRLRILFGFLAIFLLGRKRFAFLGIACVVGLIAFPPIYMGFERYYPWVLVVPLLGFALAVQYALRVVPRLKPILGVVVCGYLVYAVNSDVSKRLDFTYAVQRALEEEPIPMLYAPQDTGITPPPEKYKDTDRRSMSIQLANLKLLQREIPAFANSQVAVAPLQLPIKHFFNNEFCVPEETPLEDYSPYMKMKSLPKKERKKAKPAVIARAYGVALPHLVARRLADLF